LFRLVERRVERRMFDLLQVFTQREPALGAEVRPLRRATLRADARRLLGAATTAAALALLGRVLALASLLPHGEHCSPRGRRGATPVCAPPTIRVITPPHGEPGGRCRPNPQSDELRRGKAPFPAA